MARTKSKTSKKHKKIKTSAKGYKHARRKRVKTAKEAVLHAHQYAYVGRKLRKRDLKKLWIIRLNAAAREHGLKYSELMNRLKKANIEINKKILSDIAIKDPDTFKKIVDSVK
jgi:large subunit ribosomal protein L20